MSWEIWLFLANDMPILHLKLKLHNVALRSETRSDHQRGEQTGIPAAFGENTVGGTLVFPLLFLTVFVSICICSAFAYSFRKKMTLLLHMETFLWHCTSTNTWFGQFLPLSAFISSELSRRVSELHSSGLSGHFHLGSVLGLSFIHLVTFRDSSQHWKDVFLFSARNHCEAADVTLCVQASLQTVGFNHALWHVAMTFVSFVTMKKLKWEFPLVRF